MTPVEYETNLVLLRRPEQLPPKGQDSLLPQRQGRDMVNSKL